MQVARVEAGLTVGKVEPAWHGMAGHDRAGHFMVLQKDVGKQIAVETAVFKSPECMSTKA